MSFFPSSTVCVRTVFRLGTLTTILFACLLSFCSVATAADDAARIRAHLDAQEFAQAIVLARQIADPAARDRQLGVIAVAQANSGAKPQALRTVAAIDDDRLRSYTLHDIAGQPLGGARGGGAAPDFQSLIDLVTTTVRPDTWNNLGGPGAIDGFPGGVYFDATGLMKKVVVNPNVRPLDEARLPVIYRGGNADVSQTSELRKVSLTRLEMLAQMLWAIGRQPDESMQTLGGMTEVKYLFFYPESGDIVLAGPAGPWKKDAEGRLVNVDTGRPTLRLDDLVVLMRNAIAGSGRFGCSITPTTENLARTRAFITESAKRPLRPGAAGRATWLRKLRDSMGQQVIEVHGVDPRSRVAKIIVEADYHMKLIGMGLEEGGPDVEDYLDRIVVPAGQSPPPLDVLRWWFTLDYDGIYATEDRCAFEFRGAGVQVLSENEMLTARGQRIPTGKSEVLNRAFAHDFTKHFAQLAERYPIYAELQNVADLAMAAAVIQAEGMPRRSGWHRTHFYNGAGYKVELGVAPEKVETVIRHRIINRRHIIAGVSGGVIIHTEPLARRDAIKVEVNGTMEFDYRAATPPRDIPWNAWWWD